MTGALPRRLLHLRPRGDAWRVGVAAACDRWAPAWELDDDGVYLDLTGTERLYGHGADGPARIGREAARAWGPLAAGAAPSRLSAALASRCAAGWSAPARPASRGRRPAASATGTLCYLPPAGVGRFLAPFPLDVLAARHPAATALLRSRGVRTLGDLQALPPALLAGLLGVAGQRLAAEAVGRETVALGGGRPAGRGVVAVRLARPLSGHAGVAALLQAIAARALLACPEGPSGRASWTLRVRRAGAWEQVAVADRTAQDTLAGWRRLLEALWSRLPARRAGVSSLALLPGPRRASTGTAQGELFADATAQARLARAWRAVGAPRALHPAAEELLARWGAVWGEPGDAD